MQPTSKYDFQAIHASMVAQAFLTLWFFATVTGVEAADPQFDQSDQLQQPQNYREWIYIGTPVTPNDMNNGKAAFPEFHNVYIHPDSWKHYKNTGTFRDGTILVKELVSVGSKAATSGKGYFMGEFIGLEATVKDSTRFPKEPGNWAYFRFTTKDHTLPLNDVAKALPTEACAACHQAAAAEDMVFTQYYPLLRAAKPAK